MTGEEAITVLKMVEAHGLANEAKNIAIKALEKMDRILPLLDPDIDPDIALEKIREVMYHEQI